MRRRAFRETARDVVGDHRTVHGDHAHRYRRAEQRRRIAVADDRLRLARELPQVEVR